MDMEWQYQQANSSVPIQSGRPNPHESTEHIVRPAENKRQKRKRGCESDPSSAESDDSSSDLGPEELEIIEQEQKALEQEQKALEQEQKALKKRIRQLAKLASKVVREATSQAASTIDSEACAVRILTCLLINLPQKTTRNSQKMTIKLRPTICPWGFPARKGALTNNDFSPRAKFSAAYQHARARPSPHPYRASSP
ncbi:hypothetical protein FRC00_009658 [Tulasnella sp. 408]|nr:hypothetical protein FRC00_009658 [Tulasnella sp. 408]